MQHEVLIVDDEPDIRELLAMTLKRMDIPSRTAENLACARELLSSGKFALCLTDMRLPDGTGIELVRHIQAEHAELPVAVITAYGSMETAIEALKAGAFDFVSKPVKLDDLRNLVNSALKLSGEGFLPERRSRHSLLGDSQPMRHVRGMIVKLARSQAPVYISGESGTGKELVARLVHDKGPRADGPFVPVNCGAIPSELMESEFFGHRRGSFTGAVSDKQGLFQAADGGTLFLDEVAELPLSMQVKLLRAIQEKAVRPVGAQKEVPINVRILSATHKDLPRLAREGVFRQDLFYRINVIPLHIPPLRERPDDIPDLAAHILKRLTDRMGGGRPPGLTEDAVSALKAYPFHGNVRELENILERALTLCDNDHIERADLVLPEPEPAADGQGFRPGQEPLDEYLERIERNAITDALEQTDNNKTAAAKLLGITFRALRYKLEKLGME